MHDRARVLALSILYDNQKKAPTLKPIRLISGLFLLERIFLPNSNERIILEDTPFLTRIEDPF